MNPYIKSTVSLFDNQKHNVQALCKRRRALLTDRVGSGKSLSTLYAFSVLKAANKVSNLLVFTPLSAYEKEVWKKDIVKFTNFHCISFDSLVKEVEQSPNKIDALLSYYDVIYCKHTHVKSSTSLFYYIASKPSTIICIDEVHAFRNPKSALTLSMRDICLKSRNVWGITGSTISKSLEDLYNIVNLIYPWYFGSFTYFRNTYCTTREKVIGRVNGKLKTALQITGVKDEQAFQKVLEPLLISGESFLNVNFKYVDYNLSQFEQDLYTRIARGLTLSEDKSPEDWLQYILSTSDEPTKVPSIKEVERFSSRYIYLQSCADGILNSDGTQNREGSEKMLKLMSLISEIVSKGQSCIVYFDYYASLYVADSMLQKMNLRAKILHSTGESVLKEGSVTEASCKTIPHIILGTKASSESISYYFINNAIFFHIPTVPSTFVQFVGRITRKNTLYPDDLNVYIFRSENIDFYKLSVSSYKVYQMELTQGVERNFPPDYKQAMSKVDLVDKMKRIMLWQGNLHRNG